MHINVKIFRTLHYFSFLFQVREIEIKMDEIEVTVKAKKEVKEEEKDDEEGGSNSDQDLEEDADEFLDWRLKKV
jgi:hypothetical protein